MKKELNFEINLLPVISLLAVCICFLILTATWVNIGTLDVTQGFGESNLQKNINPPSIWAIVHPNGRVDFKLKDVKKAPQQLWQVTVKGSGKKLNLSHINNYMSRVKRKLPKIKTALILPKATSSYNNVIQLADHFKKYEIKEVGISPL